MNINRKRYLCPGCNTEGSYGSIGPGGTAICVCGRRFVPIPDPEEVSNLCADNQCDACGGTGTPPSGARCMCNGTGKLSVAVTELRTILVASMIENERLTDELYDLKENPDICHVCEESVGGRDDEIDRLRKRAVAWKAVYTTRIAMDSRNSPAINPTEAYLSSEALYLLALDTALALDKD